jgi:hypothetical protein
MRHQTVLQQAQAKSPAPRNGETTGRLHTEPVFMSTLARALHEAVKHAVALGSPSHVRLLVTTIRQSIEVARHCEDELKLLLEICEQHLKLVEHENGGVLEYERRRRL